VADLDRFDETLIYQRLAGLGLTEKAAFVAACVETLFPVYRAHSEQAANGNTQMFRSALDVCWDVAHGVHHTSGDLEARRNAVVGLAQDDEDESWTSLSGYAQCASFALAHALEFLIHNDTRDAVRVAAQLYDAADQLVQLGAPDHTYVNSIDSEEPVVLLVGRINSTLSSLEQSANADIRSEAAADGWRFWQLVEGDPLADLL
jgi:uncharacterized protein YjaG (DUF416 family)